MITTDSKAYDLNKPIMVTVDSTSNVIFVFQNGIQITSFAPPAQTFDLLGEAAITYGDYVLIESDPASSCTGNSLAFCINESYYVGSCSFTVATYGLTSLALVKQYLGITTTTYDAVLLAMIKNATAFIERACGRHFGQTQYFDEIYDTPNGDKLFLKQYPVVQVDIVEYQIGTPASPGWETYNPDWYWVYLKEGYIRLLSNFTHHDNQYFRVSYIAGYLIDFNNINDPLLHNLPADLTQLCNEVVATLYNTRTNQGIKSESTEGQSVTYDTGIGFDFTAVQKSVIANYTSFWVGT